MSLLTRTLRIAITILTISGCDRAAHYPPQHSLQPADYEAARRAISIKEVSLMLRNGYKDPAIIAEVTRRHVTEKPDPQTELALARSGAGPALIQALKIDSNVLTTSQKDAFDDLASQRVNRIDQERLVQQPQAVQENSQKPSAVEQTLQYMRNADAYKAQKENLEQRIASQEAHISLLRRNGYTEAQLVDYNEKVNRNRQQLHDLKQPMP
jgi:hypothetical protein